MNEEKPTTEQLRNLLHRRKLGTILYKVVATVGVTGNFELENIKGDKSGIWWVDPMTKTIFKRLPTAWTGSHASQNMRRLTHDNIDSMDVPKWLEEKLLVEYTVEQKHWIEEMKR